MRGRDVHLGSSSISPFLFLVFPFLFLLSLSPDPCLCFIPCSSASGQVLSLLFLHGAQHISVSHWLSALLSSSFCLPPFLTPALARAVAAAAAAAMMHFLLMEWALRMPKYGNRFSQGWDHGRQAMLALCTVLRKLRAVNTGPPYVQMLMVRRRQSDVARLWFIKGSGGCLLAAATYHSSVNVLPHSSMHACPLWSLCWALTGGETVFLGMT